MTTLNCQDKLDHNDVQCPCEAGKPLAPKADKRPRAYVENLYPWSIRRVPRTIELDHKTLPHPGRTHGIFVVHGIGEQAWTETAVTLRSGFEDALCAIAQWQCDHPERDHHDLKDYSKLSPPFLWEGYWANFENLEETFKKDWQGFNDREQRFFGRLWKLRTQSVFRTLFWFVRQQLRLLSPRVAEEVGWYAWFLYFPLQIVSLATLLFALARRTKLITAFLEDVKLYLEPAGMVEEAIVQRIDYRVGEAFLRMIGLDWDFRNLPEYERIKASGEVLQFERVVWVAHSLGTVISYNVLSDLFHRAEELKQSKDREQRDGVKRFLDSLHRFVTMGSPLDKVAFLFPDALRPWPEGSRRALLEAGETFQKDQPSEEKEWWINFYHVLDPVSGALSSPLLFGKEPPANLHIKPWYIPGWAHVAYWQDEETLRFILGRTYGKTYLRDKEYRPMSLFKVKLLSVAGYFTWALLLVGSTCLIIMWAYLKIQWAVEGLKHYIGK